MCLIWIEGVSVLENHLDWKVIRCMLNDKSESNTKTTNNALKYQCRFMQVLIPHDSIQESASSSQNISLLYMCLLIKNSHATYKDEHIRQKTRVPGDHGSQGTTVFDRKKRKCDPHHQRSANTYQRVVLTIIHDGIMAEIAAGIMQPRLMIRE